MLKNRFKKILVPLDGSLNSIRGLNEAISLARLSSSQLLGVHVLPIYPKNLLGVFDTYVRYQGKLANQFLEKAKTSAARHGIDFEHSYSWMRYYNTELHQRGVVGNEQTLLELLGEIKKTIESSLNVLKSS